MANGLIYFILSWFGILAFIQSIVNVATIGPIVLFVGTSIMGVGNGIRSIDQFLTQ
jgi:hypothetical protein